LWRGAASALVKPWPAAAAQGVVSVADPQPDSGSRRCKQRPFPRSKPGSTSEIEDEDEFEDEDDLVAATALCERVLDKQSLAA